MKKLLATCMLLTPLSCVCAMDDLHVGLAAAHSSLLDVYHPGWRASYAGSPDSAAFNHSAQVPQETKKLLQTEDHVRQVNEENRLRNALAVDVQTPDDAAAGAGNEAGAVKTLVAPRVDWATFAAAPEAAAQFPKGAYGQLRDDKTFEGQWRFSAFLEAAKTQVYDMHHLAEIFEAMVRAPLYHIMRTAETRAKDGLIVPIAHLTEQLNTFVGAAAGSSPEDFLRDLAEIRRQMTERIFLDSSIAENAFSVGTRARTLLTVADTFWEGICANPELLAPFITIQAIGPYVDFTKLDFTTLTSFEDLFAKLNGDLALVGQPVFLVGRPAVRPPHANVDDWDDPR